MQRQVCYPSIIWETFTSVTFHMTNHQTNIYFLQSTQNILCILILYTALAANQEPHTQAVNFLKKTECLFPRKKRLLYPTKYICVSFSRIIIRNCGYYIFSRNHLQKVSLHFTLLPGVFLKHEGRNKENAI